MPVLLELVAGNGVQTELSMEAAFQGELVVRAQFNNLSRHFPQKRKLSSHTHAISYKELPLNLSIAHYSL